MQCMLVMSCVPWSSETIQTVFIIRAILEKYNESRCSPNKGSNIALKPAQFAYRVSHSYHGNTGFVTYLHLHFFFFSWHLKCEHIENKSMTIIKKCQCYYNSYAKFYYYIIIWSFTPNNHLLVHVLDHLNITTQIYSYTNQETECFFSIWYYPNS